MVSQAATVSQAKESGRRKDGMRLFEKLTSVIYAAPDAKSSTCLGGLVGGRRRDVTSGTLYNLLAACLDSMPDGECNELANHQLGGGNIVTQDRIVPKYTK